MCHLTPLLPLIRKSRISTSGKLVTKLTLEKHPLDWDLLRERKERVWHPFWDRFFLERKKEASDSSKLDKLTSWYKGSKEDRDLHNVEGGSEEAVQVIKMVARFHHLRDQVSDAGVKRVLQWHNQTNPAVLRARRMFAEDLEGVDVWISHEARRDAS